jgi:hypothetical protein
MVIPTGTNRDNRKSGRDDACFIRKSAVAAGTPAAVAAVGQMSSNRHTPNNRTQPTTNMKSKKSRPGSTRVTTTTVIAAGDDHITESNGIKRRTVTFDSVILHPIPGRKYYTDREKLLTWYNGQEFMAMKSSALQLARKLDQEMMNDGSNSTHSTAATESIWSWSTLSSLSTAISGGSDSSERRQEEDESAGGDDEPDDPRGLERILRKNINKHTGRRQALRDELAFINKHDGFKHHLNDDDLAILFRSYTSVSSTEALAMGRTDEAAARKIYSEDRDFMRYFFTLFGPNALLLRRAAPSKHPQLSKTAVRNAMKGRASHESKQRRLVELPPSTAKESLTKQQFRDSISHRLIAARSIR